jgi:trk system potassium uptake protein TrkH
MLTTLLPTIGWLLIALAGAMCAPLLTAYLLDPDQSYAKSIVMVQILSAITGAVLLGITRGKEAGRLSASGGALIATVAWIVVALFSAAPFYFSGAIPSIASAIFEAVSGLTTTGASVISDFSAIPPSLLLWRSMTQWLGGIGIVVLFVAILPSVGEGSNNLFRSEIPGGVNVRKVTPRIRETARILIKIYLVMTALHILCLYLAGVSFYDSLLHSFSTMSTGGFSPWSDSLAHPESDLVRWIVIFFMTLSGCNIILHYKAITGDRLTHFKDQEFVLYLSLVFIVSILLSADRLYAGDTLQKGVTDGFFQAASIITTTGYASTDFGSWSSFSQVLIFVAMFMGGCAGSTSGSVKSIRILLAFKGLVLELKKIADPREVAVMRLGSRSLSGDDIRSNTFVFIVIFFATVGFGGIVVSLSGADPITAISSSLSCVANVGPGLGGTGPAENYGWLPGWCKLFLSGEMIAGRLELFGILIFISSMMAKKTTGRKK